MITTDFEAGRVRLSTDVLGTTIRIRPLRRSKLLLLGGAWLLVWVLVGGPALWQQADKAAAGFSPVMPWLLGTLVVGAMLLVEGLGEEVVRIENGILRLRWQVAGLGRQKQYAVADILQLRAEPDDDHTDNRYRGGRVAIPRLSGGALQFSYGLQTVRFGVRLDGYEAEELLRALRERQALPVACFA